MQVFQTISWCSFLYKCNIFTVLYCLSENTRDLQDGLVVNGDHECSDVNGPARLNLAFIEVRGVLW